MGTMANSAMARLPMTLVPLIWAVLASAMIPPDCRSYAQVSYERNPPFSEGINKLPFMRPSKECRTFHAPEVEDAILEMKKIVKDPDLFRLFENTWPNTLDTTITWRGFSQEDPNEELTFITTGDINAMWLRDSANQLQSYKAILRYSGSPDSLASVFRGAINLQGRYIRQSPYCNAFQPPVEAAADGIRSEHNTWAMKDSVVPSYNPDFVFECKYELDSLAAFLQLSYDYYEMTRDVDFFRRTQWQDTVSAIVNATSKLLGGTYSEDGRVLDSAFMFSRTTESASETVSNKGHGAPIKGDTGLVRSFFRPSDDSCIFQLFIPANMMFAQYLQACAEIMGEINLDAAGKMRGFSEAIRNGIEKYGRVNHHIFGQVYAYEVDGYGSHALMDDANIPSLLSAPMLGYLDRKDEVYQNTRQYVLSSENPYYMHGPVINATGGPHIGPGMAWPMGLIVQVMTSDNELEIARGIQQLLSSTDQLGLMHESISAHEASNWTRSWFSWVNGLFGQMLLDLRERYPELLGLSYQAT